MKPQPDATSNDTPSGTASQGDERLASALPGDSSPGRRGLVLIAAAGAIAGTGPSLALPGVGAGVGVGVGSGVGLLVGLMISRGRLPDGPTGPTSRGCGRAG